MALPISFTGPGGTDPLNIILNIRKAVKPTADDLRYAGERQKARMIARTGRGVDFEGRPFAPYSPAYMKRKEKSGRNSGVVDLNWSGRMLKAMIVKVPSPTAFSIGVYNDEGIRGAALNDGNGRMPQRRFIGVSASDKQQMTQDIGDRLNARLNGTALNAA